MKKRLLELTNYMSISVGMALTGSSFPMLGKIASLGSISAVLLGLVVAALICFVIANAIAELAARFPSAPGIRTYIMRAYGPSVSLSFTYIALAVLVMVAALEVDVFTHSLWPMASTPWRLGIGAALLVTIAVVNCVGVEASRSLQAVFCGVVIALSLVMSGPALVTGAAHLTLPIAANFWQQVLATTGLSIFLYMGFEWVTPMGKNREAYKKNIALAMLLAILTLLVIFGAFVSALMLNFSPAALAVDRAPQLSLSLLHFPRWGKAISAALLVFALLTTLNAGILAASRLLYVVAREQAFPPVLNRACVLITPDGATYGGIVVLLVLSLLTTALQMWLQRMVLIGSICAALYCCIYGAYLFSFLRLRKNGPPPSSGYRTTLPTRLIAAIAWGLPLLGVATVCSIGGEVLPALCAFALILLLSFCAAFASGKAGQAAGAGPLQPRAEN